MARGTIAFFLGILSATAFAGNAEPVWEESFADISDAQVPFTKHRNGPFTITVRDEADVRRRAEIAEVHGRIFTCDVDADSSRQSCMEHLGALDGLLDLAKETQRTCNHVVREDEDWGDDDELMPPHMRGRKSGRTDEDPLGEKKHCAQATFEVTLHDLNLLPSLRTNLTASTNSSAHIQYVDWRLTETSKTEQKNKLRRKALASLRVSAQDYAAILGYERVVPMELEEEYCYESATGSGRYGRWYMGERLEDETDLTVPEVETSVTVSGKFSAIAA